MSRTAGFCASPASSPWTAGSGATGGVLSGMYVRNAARGRGAGAQLVEAVLAHAREHVEHVHLEASVDNVAALALYERCGFQRYGTDPRALKIGNRYFDAQQMVLIL